MDNNDLVKGNNNKKITLIIMLIIGIALIIIGIIFVFSKPNSNEANQTNSATAVNEKEPTNSSYTFQIANKSFQFGDILRGVDEVLKENKFQYSKDVTKDLIESNGDETIYYNYVGEDGEYSLPDYSISVNIINTNDVATNILDCKVVGISIKNDEALKSYSTKDTSKIDALFKFQNNNSLAMGSIFDDQKVMQAYNISQKPTSEEYDTNQMIYIFDLPAKESDMRIITYNNKIVTYSIDLEYSVKYQK